MYGAPLGVRWGTDQPRVVARLMSGWEAPARTGHYSSRWEPPPRPLRKLTGSLHPISSSPPSSSPPPQQGRDPDVWRALGCLVGNRSAPRSRTSDVWVGGAGEEAGPLFSAQTGSARGEAEGAADY